MQGQQCSDISTPRGSGSTLPNNSSKSLKRGDACLACRKRRIRCGGEKPTCQTCERLYKECSYEPMQTTSRTAKLKAKIGKSVALESQVAHLSGNQGSSGSTPSLREAAESTISHDVSLNRQMGDGMDITNNTINHVGPTDQYGSTAQPSLHSASSLPQPAHAIPNHFPTAQAPISFPSSIAGPSSMPYHQTPNPRPLQPPDPNFAYDFDLLDTTMMDLSSSFDMSSGIQDVLGALSTPFTQAPPNHHAEPSHANPFASPGPSSFDPSAGNGTTLAQAPISTDILEVPQANLSNGYSSAAPPVKYGMQPWHQETLQLGEARIIPESEAGPSVSPPDEGHNLSGGWFDPDDVPPTVRDHLLDLYFGKPNVFHSLINIPRFYARLTLPLSKRPHPALLYAMYLTATHNTTQPRLKALETRFYEITKAKIEQGIGHSERELDIIRALTLLSGYLFAKEWWSMGYHVAGQAIKLATTCGLDKVPSSVWTTPLVPNVAVHHALRTGGYMIGPPEDAIELCERINAFWAVFEIDQCAAVATPWVPSFRAIDILTPLPRPLEDYVNGMVSAVDDVRLSSMFEDNVSFARSTYSDFLPLRLKAIALFAEVMRLRDLPPESPLQSGDKRFQGPLGPYRVAMGCRSILENTPRTFHNMKMVLDRYCDDIPSGHRTPWRRWDEGHWEGAMSRVRSRKETSVLWFTIGSAYMYLWTHNSMSAENEKSILVARRMASVIGMSIGEPTIGGYDAFIITIWYEVGTALIRELKRRDTLGLPALEGLEQDIDLVITALKEWVRSIEVDSHSGHGIAAFNASVMEQLRGMTREEWIEAMAEDERRIRGTVMM